MVMKPEFFGLANAVEAVQAAFISVGIWWFLFSLPMFKVVKEDKIPKNEYISWGGFLQGSKYTFSKIWNTFLELKKDRNSLRFLLSFWLYIDGVYTVMTMAVDFGKSINLETKDLMLALLLVQFLGFPFSILFSKIAQKYGCKLPILISIFFYGVTVLLAGLMTSTWHFFALSCLIGMVQGGVQALSRSMFAKMIPAKSSGEYFGLFNLVGKFAAILGPLIVGIGAYLSGNPATGINGLIILFGIGGYLLLGVKEPQAT
jgi:UMF1 family MFS transporter